jgi:hypothetical protein
VKIGEKFIDGEGSTFHVQKTFDTNPTLDQVKKIKAANPDGSFGESKHIGRVPGWMIEQWLKEAGVKFSDIPARNEVIKKKMMSGDVSKFRVWNGTY